MLVTLVAVVAVLAVVLVVLVLWRGVGGETGRIVPEDVGRCVWPSGLGFTGRRTSGTEGLEPFRLRADEEAELTDEEEPAASVRAYGSAWRAGRRVGGAYG